MKSMIEILESRTLLSAAPVAASLAMMQAEMSVVLPAIVHTSPVGRYAGTLTSSEGQTSGLGTLVIQQWNTTAGTMAFKIIGQNSTVTKGTATISGRRFTFQLQVSSTRIATFTGKMAANYASATGTYVGKNLTGVQKGTGTFSFSR